MKNENGLNLLNDNLKQHKPFDLYYKDELFARFEYNTETKRYQSDYGCLTIESIIQITKDEDDKRKIIWK